jgi:hypothetical protein
MDRSLNLGIKRCIKELTAETLSDIIMADGVGVFAWKKGHASAKSVQRLPRLILQSQSGATRGQWYESHFDVL